MPGNAALKMESRTYAIRTLFTSHPSDSAMPPHTPAIILSLERRKLIDSLLWVVTPSYAASALKFLDSKQNSAYY
jgi:hypothetical protein